MNNAWLHVCISIIQTNHYIYSIIFIMNYSPAWSARWQPGRRARVWMKVAGLIVEWFLKRGGKFLKCIFVHKRAKGSFLLTPLSRTKWKRQTAVGLELLAEAGNYSALQRMFPSPYFYPQSLVSNLDPGAALYLYRGPSAPPPTMQRPLVPRILLHGLQGGSEPPPPPPPLAPMSGVLPRPAQQRWAGTCRVLIPPPLTLLPTFLNMPTFLQLWTHSKKRSKRQIKIRE